MANQEMKYYGLFNDSFPPIIDGVTLTVVNYAEHMEREGMNPLIVTPRNPQAHDTSYPQLRYFSLPIWNRKPYRYGYPKLDFSIWRRLRQHKFQLVHSHSPFAAGRLAVYASRKQGIPLIGTFHSKYRTDLEHSFRHLPWMTRIIMHRIRAFYAACDEIWIPQAKVEETVREYGIKGKVTVVENGNDMADFAGEHPELFIRESREKLGIAPETLSLLFVGQHIWEKGIGIIAEALAKIDKSIDFRMDYIGTGYAAAELKQMVKRLGLEDRVHIHGSVTDRDRLMRHYAAADLFLFPSFYDNAPLVVREAAAFSTPSILLKGSTASEVIEDGVNGFLTDRTPEDYATLITSLAKERARIIDAGHNARKTLVRSWADVMDEVYGHYDRILTSFRKRTV